MIARMWTGWTNTDQARGYESYMHEVALDGYGDIPGNRGVLMLRRDLGDGRSEFTMVSLWDSIEVIRDFAGDPPTTAVFYDRDDEFLIERETTVRHYEVYGTTPAIRVDAQESAPPRRDES